MADDFLYHFSDEDDDEDALLDGAVDRWEQIGGGSARGPLFQFTMQPMGRRRRRREVVERAQFNVQWRQLRDPVAGNNIGMALTEALHQAIETELDREQRPAHHFVNFAITAHGFTHAYQTANFTVGEFLQRTARLDEMLATLAGKLNSNEAFNPDRSFQVDVVFVSMPGPGSGYRKKKAKSWSSVSGPRKQKKTMQEKTMHHHHQKQRCFMLCSGHRCQASALPQSSRRGWVSPMRQFKAWASCAATSSPGTAS